VPPPPTPTPPADALLLLPLSARRSAYPKNKQAASTSGQAAARAVESSLDAGRVRNVLATRCQEERSRVASGLQAMESAIKEAAEQLTLLAGQGPLLEARELMARVLAMQHESAAHAEALGGLQAAWAPGLKETAWGRELKAGSGGRCV